MNSKDQFAASNPQCELLQDDPVEITGRRRFTFNCTKGQETVELILRTLLESNNFEISEFQVCRPDLETIFLKATKQNWQEMDLLGRGKNKIF